MLIEDYFKSKGFVRYFYTKESDNYGEIVYRLNYNDNLFCEHGHIIRITACSRDSNFNVGIKDIESCKYLYMDLLLNCLPMGKPERTPYVRISERSFINVMGGLPYGWRNYLRKENDPEYVMAAYVTVEQLEYIISIMNKGKIIIPDSGDIWNQ